MRRKKHQIFIDIVNFKIAQIHEITKNILIGNNFFEHSGPNPHARSKTPQPAPRSEILKAISELSPQVAARNSGGSGKKNHHHRNAKKNDSFNSPEDANQHGGSYMRLWRESKDLRD